MAQRKVVLDFDEKCGTCGHAFKFHVDHLGSAQACDVEMVEPGMGIARLMTAPEFCGCAQFVQVADPEEVLAAPSRCMICGEEGGGHGPGCVLHEE